MSAFGYPVNLDLRGKRCVVIGTLPVREGRVDGLVAGGATDVLVVATGPAARLDELERVEGVTVERRPWRADDLNGAVIVLAHDDHGSVRAAIAREARARRILVNLVDDIPHCDFAMPALVRRGALTLAIGTGGGSPAVARKLRERLEAAFGPEWAEVIKVLSEVRAETLPSLPSFADRAERWRAALDLDEAAAMVREGRAEELRATLRDRLLQGVAP